MNRTIVVTSIFLFSLSLFGKGRTERLGSFFGTYGL